MCVLAAAAWVRRRTQLDTTGFCSKNIASDGNSKLTCMYKSRTILGGLRRSGRGKNCWSIRPWSDLDINWSYVPHDAWRNHDIYASWSVILTQLKRKSAEFSVTSLTFELWHFNPKINLNNFLSHRASMQIRLMKLCQVLNVLITFEAHASTNSLRQKSRHEHNAFDQIRKKVKEKVKIRYLLWRFLRELYPVYTIKLARRAGYVSWTSQLDVCWTFARHLHNVCSIFGSIV